MERRKAGLRHRRGQSIVEYLLILGAIILALVVVGGNVTTKMTNLRNESVSKVDTAATTVGTVDAARH